MKGNAAYYSAFGRPVSIMALIIASAVSQAQAQESAPTEAGGSSIQLEEIIVLAQKRSEAAQDIPVAISAVSAASLERAAISDLQGMTKGMVGIQYDSPQVTRPEIYIRGIGTNRFDIGADPSSGMYIDEIYQPRFANFMNGLADLERIEVLRGPQGTLFGRNTVGGAISIYTAQPEREFGGKVVVIYGNKDYINLAGSVSVPFNQSVRGRFSVGYSDRDGFNVDTVSGRTDGNTTFTLRGKLEFDLSEEATFQLSAMHFDSEAHAALRNPANLPIYLASPFALQTIDNDHYSGAYTLPGLGRVKSTQVGGRLELDNEAVKTTVIGSYLHFSRDFAEDADGNILDSLSFTSPSTTDSYSLEFRLSSQTGGILTFNDNLRWVMGAFLYQDKGNQLSTFHFGRDNILALVNGPNLQLLGPPPYTPPFSPPRPFDDSVELSNNLKSIAFYSQATLDLTEHLAVTLGGRYTSDNRSFSFTGTRDPAKLPGLPVVVANYVYNGKVNADAFTPRAAIEFKPATDVLLYASYSRGFKSAAIQSTAFNPAVAAAITRPESINAYEIGFKSEFFNRRIRLNIAAFHNDYSDIQVRRVVPVNGVATAITENAATATIRGVEVESSALLFSGFRINASYAYLDAKYDRYVVGGGADFSGNRLPRAPRHRFNVDANYTLDFNDGAKLDLRAAYNYTGTFFFQPDNLAIEKETPYGLTDVSGTFRLANETTSVQLWGRNIFGVEYRTYLDPLSTSRVEAWSDKATYGVTVTQKF